MRAKSTPGPWSPAANWPHGLSMICQHDGSGWRPVADCAVSGEKAEANARLISAAPDLLEALQDLFGADMEHVLMGDGKDDQIAAIAKARAAIAKATGSAQ